jgi:hypothetical protein
MDRQARGPSYGSVEYRGSELRHLQMPLKRQVACCVEEDASGHVRGYPLHLAEGGRHPWRQYLHCEALGEGWDAACKANWSPVVRVRRGT